MKTAGIRGGRTGRPGAARWAAILVGLGAVAAPAQTPPVAGVTEAVRLQQVAKRRYQELTRIMAEVSRKLETSDPKTAATIAGAAQKAEVALIAEEMDKVVDLLQSGLVLPADSAQGKVVLRLREVLKALKGEEGLEWRLFLLEELRQQMEDLNLLVQRQRVLELRSRMLAFGDRMRARVAEARASCGDLDRREEELLKQTRTLQPSPAAMRFVAIRQGIVGMLRGFDAAKGTLWNPTPSTDLLARNIASVRRAFAETAALRTELRTVSNEEEIRRVLEASRTVAACTNAVGAMARAADELDRGARAMGAGDVSEGILALSEASALLGDALTALDAAVEGFSDVKPAVAIAAAQKAVDDGMSQLETPLRDLLPAGETTLDDSPDGDERMVQMTDRLTVRRTEWMSESAVAIALNPAGLASRQEQVLAKLRDWSERLTEAAAEIERTNRDPRYPAQKHDQSGITTDLRGMLDVNKSRAETVDKDVELTQIFGVLRTGMENASDYSRKAADHLGRELPREANTNQNDVIHLLTDVMNAVGPELKMDQNKYAMNEQAQARIQRMIIKQKICLGETKQVWSRRPADGAFGRPERLRIEAIARDERSLGDDADAIWAIVNTAHNIGYNTFPAEARLMLEMVRLDLVVIEKRLLGIDPGMETQELQQIVLDRLKAIEKMAGQEDPTGAKEMDRRFTYDSFLSRGPINSQARVPILLMLISLQEDLVRRTAMLDRARRAGRAAAGADAEAEQLRQLQENIRAQLDEYARLDAAAWKRADFMPTQYGSSQGGTKQFFISGPGATP